MSSHFRRPAPALAALSLFAGAAWAQAPAVEPLPPEPAAVEPATAEPATVEPAAPATADPAVPEPTEPTLAEPTDPDDLDGSATIIGSAEERARVGGSAYAVPKAALETAEYDDIHRVLNRVPGVNTRGEDGFGLRPNIGIRGANSERSQKVTLLEDGLLLGPAPYSAPAAYFFPQSTRMVGVEVIKGPAALQHGPQSIGGAINLQTRGVPADGHRGGLDVAAGQLGYGKLHGHWGHGGERFGVLLEGVRVQSTGFKILDGDGGGGPEGGGDTGFGLTEAMLKMRYNTNPDAEVFQRFDLKLTVSTEQSRETYLGLARDDFEADPYRRYAASARDFMDWTRFAGALGHTLEWGSKFTLRSAVYRNQMSRAWRKFNRFGAAGMEQNPDLGAPIDAHALLRGNPAGRASIYRDVLAGRTDTDDAAGGPSGGITDYDLMIGTNDRDYVSQGVQTAAQIKLDHGGVTQSIEVGVRLHHDVITRDHTEDAHRMVDGTPVRRSGVDQLVTRRNEDDALALAAWLLDDVGLGDRVFVRPGVRVEHITTGRTDTTPRLDPNTGAARPFDADLSNTTTAVVPGVGVYWQATEWLGVLGGVHRGFSPVAPGQPDEVEPEYALNTEAGLRFTLPWLRAEAIGFFNQYSNIVGNCTFSAGCDDAAAGAQFNGGDADIYGVEAVVAAHRELARGYVLNLDLSYTYTVAEFETAFQSAFPQWGRVQAGDAMPYLPQHLVFLGLGLTHDRFGVDVAVQHTSAQRDVAGQGEIPTEQRIDAYTVIDAGARWHLGFSNQVYLRCNNVLDTVYNTSMRPFGLRPGLPRQVILGYKHEFGG